MAFQSYPEMGHNGLAFIPVLALGRGLTLGNVTLCSQDSSIAEAIPEGGLLAAGPPSPSSRGSWVVHPNSATSCS